MHRKNFTWFVAAIFLSCSILYSCTSPSPGVYTLSTENLQQPSKSIDPRLIGTWVGAGKYEGRNCAMILVLPPNGEGKIHARTRQGFKKTGIKWSTRSNILELKEHHELLGDWNVWLSDNPSYNHRNPPPRPIEGKRRYNITAFSAGKFQARDLASPSNRSTFYKYSNTPISDPYPVFAWFDNGSYKKNQ